MGSSKRSDRARHGDYRAITYPGHFNLPTALTEEEDFYSLSGSALKLLIEIGRQYKGHNNGDLTATLSMLRRRGWNSNHKITRALKELIAKNLIILTRHGGMGIGPNLYAITWQPINQCKGKLEVEPTSTAPRKLRHITTTPHPLSGRQVPTIGAE